MMTKHISALLIVGLLYSCSLAFPPVWDDSDYLALVYANTIQAPGEYAPLIIDHRNLIEVTCSDVEGFTIRREWEPSRVFCRLTEAGWSDFMGGGFQELRDKMVVHSCVAIDADYSMRILYIVGFVPLHSQLLADEFAQLDEVQYCYPESWCCDGPIIEVLELGPTSRYLYRDAWEDCVMGCIFEHFWEFEVTDGVATLVAEWGDEVGNELMSWGAVKNAWR